MRRDAILVNGARAGIVNEEALKKTLREGRIKAAAFDVLENHPLKPEDEYLTFENMNLGVSKGCFRTGGKVPPTPPRW